MKSTDGKNYTAIPEATKDTYFVPKEFEDKTYHILDCKSQ